MNAPIALFVYNRPQHTKRLLESLELNSLSKESSLYIFADGPKAGASKEQLDNLHKTRKIIRSKKWCKKVTVIERKKNMGLAKSVIEGVTQVINKHGKIIVLEDDLVLSPHFLEYMNKALDIYKNNKRVMQISGFMYPVVKKLNHDAIFLPFTNSWGWGTWKRSWDKFENSSASFELLRKDSKLRFKFDLEGSYPFYKMLLQQKSNRLDSWAIKFYSSVFCDNGLVLYPAKTLVENYGFGSEGTHTKIGIRQEQIDDKFIVVKFPMKVFVNKSVVKNVQSFIKTQNNIFIRICKLLIKIMANNLFIFYKRLIDFIKRHRYVIGKNSVLYWGSEIVNIYGDKNRIIIGENTHIRGQLMTFAHGGFIKIGNYCFVGKNTNIWSAKKIIIGNRVLIAHNVNIFDSDTHPIDSRSRHRHFVEIVKKGHPKEIELNEQEVVIGDDVWIGASSIVLKGVNIGKGAVVGAGSVVTKDVKPYTVVAGNPTRIIKEINNE